MPPHKQAGHVYPNASDGVASNDNGSLMEFETSPRNISADQTLRGSKFDIVPLDFEDFLDLMILKIQYQKNSISLSQKAQESDYNSHWFSAKSVSSRAVSKGKIEEYPSGKREVMSSQELRMQTNRE
jgi:protein tyrosine/serine phosphatase